MVASWKRPCSGNNCKDAAFIEEKGRLFCFSCWDKWRKAQVACACGSTMVVGWFQKQRKLVSWRSSQSEAAWQPAKQVPLCMSCIRKVVEEHLS